ALGVPAHAAARLAAERDGAGELAHDDLKARRESEDHAEAATSADVSARRSRRRARLPMMRTPLPGSLVAFRSGSSSPCAAVRTATRVTPATEGSDGPSGTV